MAERKCRWCSGPIPPAARIDSIYCGTPHRQAAHRAKVDRVQLAATDTPLRLAYADPPYMGLSKRYYGDHPDFAGEVDHAKLVRTLAGYDGWALSCSSGSVPAIASLLVAAGVPSARLAVWHRRRPPHPTARILSTWEGVFYSPARTVVSGSKVTDVLLGVDAPRRPSLPGNVIGMKPPRFLAWLFELIGARPGDSLDDLFPGSGMVGRAWASWSAGADASLVPPADLFA